jgi:hypothetical protein
MQPADKPSVSTTFVERFNAAASLARDGQFDDALKAYARIHAPFEDRTEDRIMTSEFLGMIELGKAYCFIKLERMQEAKALLESRTIKTAHTQLPQRTQYEYFFLYGNTLGHLGLITQMDSVMKRALHVALNDLEDSTLCVRVWHWILYWAKQHKDWMYLEEQCYAARAFSTKHDNPEIQDEAQEFICHAYRGLGKIDKARSCTKNVLKKYKDEQTPTDAVREWEHFLESLNVADSNKS